MPALLDPLSGGLIVAAMKSFGISLIASVAVLAQLAIVLILVGIVATRVSAGGRAAFAIPRTFIGRYGVWIAWFVATFATASSLWLSEVKNFEPCHLCWLQRYFMYPLVLLLPVVALIRRRWVTWAAMLVPLFGLGISTWHVYVEANPSAQTKGCFKGIPCSFKWVDEFGYVTIPLMAGTAFLLIILLLGVAGAHQRRAAAAGETNGV